MTPELWILICGSALGGLFIFTLMWEPKALKDLSEENQAEQEALREVARQALATEAPKHHRSQLKATIDPTQKNRESYGEIVLTTPRKRTTLNNDAQQAIKRGPGRPRKVA